MHRSQCHKVTTSQEKAAIKNYFAVFLTCILCLLTCDLFAQPISSTELINNAKQYDGKTVLYKGEAIGDAMRRGQHAWINLNDENNAIGIWMSADMIKDVITGNFKSKGDIVEISGVFHRSCPDHGGDLDIHAQAMRKISSGFHMTEKVDLDKARLSITFALIAGLVWILSLLNKQQSLK